MDTVDPRIASACAEMERRLNEPLSVEELAAQAGLPPAEFSRLFRDAMGLPPKQHLQGLRMARAKLLLERTFLTVTQVLTRVGVTDGRHFARDFRKRYGLAPRELRHRAWEGAVRQTYPADDQVPRSRP